jgi:hypothetical protein
MLTEGIHQETPFNIDFGINNERQYYKTGTVGEGACGRERVNGGDEDENMVDGLHIHTQNRMMKPLAIALSGAGKG